MASATSPAWAWFNGRLTPFGEAKVPIEDRGLQFGESLYEVVAMVGGEPFRLADHAERMRKGAAELGLESGVPNLALWRDILARLHHREPHPSALLYAQVTGGEAPRRHVPAEAQRPFFFAYLRPYTFPAPTETSRGISATTLPDSRWQRRDLKTTMLLPAVMAKRLAGSQGAEEMIFIGQDGYVTEGASSTLFAVHNREVSTPPANERILDGISARVVREICSELGVAYSHRPITLSDLRRADEVLVASTTFLLMPVVRLDGSPVGSGTPGSVSLQLAYHFQRRFWGSVQS
ncbi:MAG: aminotransferase class IV [Thermoanaerobaculales bacterium]